MLQSLLWTNTNQTRFFLIPDEVELIKGSYEIHTFSQDEKCTNENILIAFEIDKEQARAYLENELNLAIEDTRTAFHNLQAFHQTDLIEYPELKTSFLNDSQPIQDLVHTILDFMPENKFSHKAGEPIAISDTDKAELQHKIEEYLSSPEAEQYLNTIASKLKNLANQLEQPAKRGKNLNEIIRYLTSDLVSAFDEGINKVEREKEIERSVKESIAASFKAHGLKSFSAGDFDEDK